MNFGHISEEVPKSVDGWLTDLMRQHQGVSLKISKTYLNARKSKQLCHSACNVQNLQSLFSAYRLILLLLIFVVLAPVSRD